MSDPPIIVWFRRDLRLDDHAALAAAASAGRPILPVYVCDTTDPRPLGAAAQWWLHQSLSALDTALRRKGVGLTLRRGAPVDELARLIDQTGAAAVYWNRAYTPHQRQVDSAVVRVLESRGVVVRSFAGALLAEPSAVTTQSGGPYKIFTAFHQAMAAGPPPATPLPAPVALRPFARAVPSDVLADWALQPTSPDWAGGLRAAWTPGEDGARRQLLRFIDDAMRGYDRVRNTPARPGTSRLSPHLAFGELSPGRVWHTIAAHAPAPGRDAWLRQLVWREFSQHLLHHFPEMPDRPLRPEFARFPWVVDDSGLKSWRRGRTGYPIVDAGMRELWTTGWMHNRVRMIVASFLTKHLRIDWRVGAAWFWDTLVDADLGNNAAGWQWVAGCGVDAAPYFRIFNPVLQGEKFDPDGAYVRRWCPELADVPATAIHAPWRAVEPPAAYPAPIVDHAGARAAALAAFRRIRD